MYYVKLLEFMFYTILIICYLANQIIVFLRLLDDQYDKKRDFLFDLIIPFGLLIRNCYTSFKQLK